MDLLQTFEDIKIKRTQLVKLCSLLKDTEQDLDKKNTELMKVKTSLDKEYKEHKRIEDSTLTSLFYAILGSKTAKLEKERQEYLFVKLSHDNLIQEITLLESKKQKLLLAIEPLKPVEQEYQDLLLQKEQYLSDIQDKKSIKLHKINEKLSNLKITIKEIDEAIEAGKVAHRELVDIIKNLDSAQNWGMLDMVGGGLITTAIKHSKIDGAKRKISKGQYAINRFTKELKDLDFDLGIEQSIQINDFYKFSDFIFDGLIFDFIVQEKINKSMRYIKNISIKIHHICDTLIRKKGHFLKEEQIHTQKRINILND